MANVDMLVMLSVVFVALIGQNAVESYLWKPLVEVPNEAFEKAFVPNYLDQNLLQTDSLSAPCRLQLRAALNALSQRRNWAAKLFNSWAKFPPSGTLRGTLTDFGDYDQCLSLHVVRSQYCLVDIAVPMPAMPKFHNYHHHAHVLPDHLLTNDTVYSDLARASSVFYYVYIQIGVCLPQQCTTHDARVIANNASSQLGLSVNKLRCETKSIDGKNFNIVQWFAISLVIIMGIVTTAAALYDRMIDHKTTPANEKVLLWFSPGRNIRKLVTTKSSDDLVCIHGLRFFTMVWIIIGHTLEWNNLNIFRDTFSIRDKLSDLGKQPLYKGHYSVDTFFYLSGLLTSYVILKYTNGEYRNFRYGSFFLLRYLRLTPQLGVFLLLTSLLPPMFDGPLWKGYMSKLTDRCYANWWSNVLYVQNLVNIENICAVHTWYLAADMQLHWIALVPVVIILKNRTQGIIFTKLLILVCVCISGVTIFLQKLPPGSVITSKNNFLDEEGRPTAFISFFYKPWNHVSVFFIGFIFGAYIHNTSWKKTPMQKWTKLWLWASVCSGYLFCMYSTTAWLFGRAYDPVWSAVLLPTNQVVWALMLTALVWLCLTHNGTVVGRVLCWSGWRPLSRTTYSVYLSHSWVLWIALGTRRELIDLSTRSITLLCCALITASYVVGFIFTVLVETPLIHVLDHIKHNLLDQSKPEHGKVQPLNIELETERKLITSI